MLDYQTYYQMIEKPAFAAPEWAFSLAWGIIYPLLLVAFFSLLYYALTNRAPWSLVGLFAFNIVANLLFTPLQLGFPEEVWATLDILVILVSLSVLMLKVYRYSRGVCVLLIPYLLWGTYATILQVVIYVTNFL